MKVFCKYCPLKGQGLKTDTILRAVQNFDWDL